MKNTVANIRNLVHPKCVVCGFGNGNGLHLEFDIVVGASSSIPEELVLAYLQDTLQIGDNICDH